ncbi:hypothetical protein [Desulfosporosinus lacus]|uniref:Uncharacterized protein n=1 Tax=Desulfosporosinus lacus DSM 15449 TaxID=1121420 RepID=A0A1M5WIG0_9FIRM|nr:hypothetical protein [Desulfosporosinus lacus]SHH87178.1 hypothetical protein SAMN02746098_01629 [Desulfosporosinus lacus DSM 15449]
MEYHCECCMCPKDIWTRSLTTYNGDECQLYESFLSLLEDWMTAKDLSKVAIEELPKEYSDIYDIVATVKEMVDIVVDCGVISSTT